MDFDTDLFVKTFVTLLVVMDPLGNIPVFLVLTGDRTLAQRRRIALQAAGLAAFVILAFALFGQGILTVLGITLTSLQVAGGLLLALIALELLNPVATEEQTLADRGNVALVPLGTPLLAGPGAIAATMLYMRQAETAAGTATVVVALLAALVTVYAALRYAPLLSRLLKDGGIRVLTRVMGLLVAAIAVQMVATGIEEWVRNGVD